MELYKIAVSPGDSVGEELIAQARKLFHALEQKYGVHFELTEICSCGPAIDRWGTALRDEDILSAASCRAILFGNIGYAGTASGATSVYALTAMRRAFQVCTNIRPVRLYQEAESLSPLKPSITSRGMDILIVRDLMGGMINGERHQWQGQHGRTASDLECYSEEVIAHSAHFAFASARERRGLVTSVDKANILSSSKLWRQKVCEVSQSYPELRLEHDYVDHAAMELLMRPWSYDVILTSNVFGDILADEVAQITGTPWMFGSAELAKDGRGVYTPNQLHHPLGEELAGKDTVSPYGIMDAVSLLLRYSCGRPDMADAVDASIRQAVNAGLFTREAVPEGSTIIGTDDLGSTVAASLS